MRRPAPVEEEVAPTAIDLDEWPERLLLSSEKEALGLYLTGHPFDAVRADARCFVDGTLVFGTPTIAFAPRLPFS